MESAKDDFTPYSILKITETQAFLCQEMKNDFKRTTKVICAFSKRPVGKIKNLQNDFFKVNTFYKKDTFFLSITPFHKIKLIPQIFNLVEDSTIYQADVSLAKTWLVIGYKKKLPLIQKRSKPDNNLAFPFYLDQDSMPYVGSLDLHGNPVHIQEVGDVTKYLKVKKLYAQKQYESAMETIDDVLEEYPDTLFEAELIYYKIKVHALLHEYNDVIESAKIYLNEYSSSDNIAEILSLIAQAYSKVGMNGDADYFFDRLFSEHKNTKFVQLGYIYKGEMLASDGEKIKAMKFYKKALYETSDLDVAAYAAYDIAKSHIKLNPKDATIYIDKIITLKPGYFNENYQSSVKMMNIFADEALYGTAAKIATALVDAIGITSDDYEELLGKRALWLAQTESKKEGLAALNRYLKEFPEGDYVAQVQIAKDGLFFETSDANVSTKLAEYDKLIQEYSKDTIGQKALYEKAKLLLENKRYSDVLAMQHDLAVLDGKYDDLKDIITNAAKGMMDISLKNKKCKDVLVIVNDYNITLSDSWDDGIYDCAMKGGNYTLSKRIAEKNFQSKDLAFRKKWLYRYIKIDFATGNYSDVIEASKDLIALIEDEKNSPYQEVYRYLFDTYNRLEKREKLLDSMLLIEKNFGESYKDIERYVTMMTLGREKKDDNLVINYGKKVQKIQKSSSTYVQSPYVEFTLYQSYMNLKEYRKALEIIKNLDRVTLSKSKRARAEYLKGMALMKLWRDREAQKAYDAAIKANPDSAWAKLAKSAKEL